MNTWMMLIKVKRKTCVVKCHRINETVCPVNAMDDVKFDKADHDLLDDQLSEEDCDNDYNDVVRHAVVVETTTIMAAAGREAG